MDTPFEIRGVIEGFYGNFYTFPQRNDMIQFLGEQDFNLYIYGPKNDRLHRNHWRAPYPDEVMERFRETIQISKEAGIEFCFSLGSGVSMNYASQEDMNIIKAKFRTFYDIGVRTFCILLDDISSEFRYEEEKQKFRSYAEAHQFVCNDLYDWLKSLDQDCSLMMCPTDYHGSSPFSSYIHELGDGLYPEVDIFYTGPEICSPTMPADEVDAFGNAVKRQPIIWDNYPVNDLAMQPEMHIGPITGRGSNLTQASKGFVINTMIEPEASKIPLLTFADYFRDPVHYVPWDSWEKALQKIAGDSSPYLRKFAENSLHSCLGFSEAEKLEHLTDNAFHQLQAGKPVLGNRAVDELEDYLQEVDAACYHLKNFMGNYELRNDLLPWIDLLGEWYWVGQRSLNILKATERNEPYAKTLNQLEESLEKVKRHPKRIAGTILLPLAEWALKKVHHEEVAK